MNIVLVRSSYEDWRECPVCGTKNYPRDNSGKFALDWYAICTSDCDVSTYLLIVGIVAGDCKVKIGLILTLTAADGSPKWILKLLVTFVFTNV